MDPLQKYQDALRSADFAVDVKASPGGVITGWASTYDATPDRQGDVVIPGAFTKTLAAHKARGTAPAMLWAHKMESPVGHWTAIEDDAHGLRVTGQLNLNTDEGRKAYAHVSAGDVGGFSIGYIVTAEGGRRYLGGGAWALDEVDLVEISLVSAPANPNAKLDGVKAPPVISTKSQAVQFLRDAGLSKAAATRFAAGGFPALAPETDAQERALKLAAEIEAATKRMRLHHG